MTFVINDNDALDKHNEIWDKIKNAKFHSMPVYDEKYLKAKIREFNCVIKTTFLGDEIPKENVHHTCTSCITIDFVMKMENNFLQVYLDECKYKSMKIKMTKFINTELESESWSESELKSDTELESKRKSDSQ